jgi:stage V sporulation protein K
MSFDRRGILFAVLGLAGMVAAIVIASAITGWLGGLGGAIMALLQAIKPVLVWGGGLVTLLGLLFIILCLYGAWPGLSEAGAPIARERPILKKFREVLAPGSVKNVDPNIALAELSRMVGLAPVKTEINRLLTLLEVEQRRQAGGIAGRTTSLHMVFAGPAGVGKTAVARTLGQIYVSTGMLKRGHLIEADRSTLVAGYTGQTAIKTLGVCRRALDGVLFIDEAYALAPKSGGDTFGQEAINTLLKFMEDNRGRIAVVAAGYSSEMRHFLASNPGLSGRFTRQIEFPPYSEDELLTIFSTLIRDAKFNLPEEWERVARPWVREAMRREDWANARSMRSLVDRVRECQAERIADIPGADLNQIEREDLRFATESVG